MGNRPLEGPFSNEFVDALFRYSGGVAAVVDVAGTILHVAGDTDTFFGIASDQFIGQSVFDIVQSSDLERARLRWRQAFESATPLPSEDYWVQVGGRWLCLRAVVSNFLDDVRMGALVVNLEDVTGLKNAESARSTLLGSRSALVRVSSEGDLYSEICHVVSGDVAFDLAWIGLVDESYPLGVRMVATGGPVAYFDALEELSTTQTYHGPIADAIETRKIQVIESIAATPQTESMWRDLALAHGYNSGAVLPIADFGVLAIYSKRANAFGHEVVQVLTALVDDLAQGAAALRARAERVANRYRLESSLEATVRAIATAAELRDPYTAGHQRRVEYLARAIAADMGLAQDETTGIGVAASIHDVGKLVVPAEILSKPGRLTALEFEFVKGHSQAGYDIIAGIDFPWRVAEMILDHHERLNGSGYPRGLKAEDIFLGTRILSVADVTEAMRSHRPYRPALGIDAALRELEIGRGTLYDPDVVESCIGLFRENRFEFQLS